MPLAPAPVDEKRVQEMAILDLVARRKPFKNPNWQPSQRRNKNVKQLLGDVARKDHGTLIQTETTNAPERPHHASLMVPADASGQTLEQGVQASLAQADSQRASMMITYTNIESAPSLHPGDKRHYCDITGLPATYTDPKSRLRYTNKEVFEVIRNLPAGAAERYLEARAAHVILK